MIPYHHDQPGSIPNEHWYKQSIEELSSRFPDDAPGFFGPGSITWKVFREPGILIGSYRALLLQVAHPAVGAGVKIYSDFQKDYLGRAYRTFLNMASIFFGSCSLAKKTANHLHTMHYRIRGVYINERGVQKSFCANDPKLLTWILVTLMDTAIQAYEQLLPALTITEKEKLIEEAQVTAQLMGIPEGYFPKNHSDFIQYFNQITHSQELEIGTTAKVLAKDILRGPFPFLQKTTRLFSGALLPDRLVEDYHLTWNNRLKKRFEKRISWWRRIYNWWPDQLRFAPPFHQATYRIAHSQRKVQKFLPKLFHWLAQYIKTPFLIQN